MHRRDNSASLRLWLGMKRGLFGVRPLNLLPYCSQSLLIGDHPRQPLVAVDLGVEFDALLAHSHLAASECSINANAVRWSAVPSANGAARSAAPLGKRKLRRDE
jgi:hypothetical protein